jgi:hypothetical protein
MMLSNLRGALQLPRAILRKMVSIDIDWDKRKKLPL